MLRLKGIATYGKVDVFVVGASWFSNVRVYAPWWAGDLKIMGIMMCV